MEQVYSYNIIKYILTQKQYKVNNYKLQIILYLIYKDYIKESNSIPKEFDDLEIIVSKYSIKFEPIYTSLIVFGTSDFNCFNDDLILKELKNYITLPHNFNIYKLDDSLKIIIDNVLEETKEKGIDTYFKNLVGIQDIYGASKEAAGRAFFEKANLDPSKALFIGDSLHDEEVSIAFKGRCALIAKGHQSREVLLKGKAKEDTLIFSSLSELQKALFFKDQKKKRFVLQ